MRAPILLLLLASAGAGVARAQAPSGDATATILPDSIYHLAVDSADYPGESRVFLLDYGLIHLEPDGRSSRTYRQVVQILRPQAIEDEVEHTFSWNPDDEKLTVNWLRVVRPDGSVISPGPSHRQESDVPAETTDPVYQNRRIIRMSLSGVAVGTLVDYSYTITKLKPVPAGDFYQFWGVSTGLSVRRSFYQVDVPQSTRLAVLEKNLDFSRQESHAGGRHIFRWARQDMHQLKPEPYASDSGVYMSVRVALPSTWEKIAGWYAGLAKGRYAVTPGLARTIDSIIAPARSRRDTIEDLHRYVAQDIRYVSIDLGLSGYQPRPPAETVRTGFGDCKDKATLFVAALQHLGIPAYPVLLSATGGVDRELPSVHQLDHAIAAIPGDSGYTFVDLTAPYTPLGTLPYGEQGEFGLVVHPDGRGEVVTLPLDPPSANLTVVQLEGDLEQDGTFSGSYRVEASGTEQYSLREAFANPFDSTQRARFAMNFARKIFDNAEPDSVSLFNGKDLDTQARVAVRVHGATLAHGAGAAEILSLPFGSMSGFMDEGDKLASRGPRTLPIDVGAVVGPITSRWELRLRLPPGWHADLPPSFAIRGPFGTYHTSYRQEGRSLYLDRELSGTTGVLPPDRVDELVSWLRGVGRDDARFIVLEKAPGGSPAGGQ